MDPDLLIFQIILGFCVVLCVTALTMLHMIGSTVCRLLYEISDSVDDIRMVAFDIRTEQIDPGFFGRTYRTTVANQGDSPVFDEEDEVTSPRRGPP